MSLTSNQQASISNLNSQLQNQTNLLIATSSSPGQDAINLSIAASYTSNLSIVSAISAPALFMQTQIANALNNVTTPLLWAISDSIDILSTNITLPNIPKITTDTSLAIINYGNVSLNFNDILDNAMKALNTNDQFPNSVINIVNSSLMDLKKNMLNQVFDLLEVTFLTPIQTYSQYIESTGILDLLNLMVNFEKCMLNQNTLDRPRQELFFPGTTQYNSQYYFDLFKINIVGDINFGKIYPSISEIENKLSKIVSKINIFTNVSIPLNKTNTTGVVYNPSNTK